MAGREHTWTWVEYKNDMVLVERPVKACWALNEGTTVSKAASQLLKEINEQLELRAIAQRPAADPSTT